MRPVRLRLLPLAFATILVTTAVPVELGADAGWRSTLNPWDILQNLLLYLPLGFALGRGSFRTILLVSGLLALTIEISQLWGINRFASPVDVSANILGAMIGRLLWQRRAPAPPPGVGGYRVTGAGLGCAAALLLALLLAWSAPVRSSGLEGWDPGFPLLIGNERTPDRPWQGRVATLTLLPFATLVETAAPGDTADGAYALPRPVVAAGGPAVVLPSDASRRFTQAARRHNGFTLAARITPSSANQAGPARIVSLSADTLHRNFDLGQEGDRLVLRVSTPVSGANGNEYRAVTPSVVRAGEELTVVGIYDGATSRIYVNGVLGARSSLAAAGCSIRALCDWALPPAWAALGGLLALLGLSIKVPRSGQGAVLRAGLAGIVALGVPQFLASGVVLRTGAHWMPLTALLGALAVGLAWNPPLDGTGQGFYSGGGYPGPAPPADSSPARSSGP